MINRAERHDDHAVAFGFDMNGDQRAARIRLSGCDVLDLELSYRHPLPVPVDVDVEQLLEPTP